ncbi:hypothetical protein MHF_0541 [Mycoplasma haemofelis Ohio2]|uniref:Uncharacterized protein n=1 Tax=Mycoplasma haemofelis (strain Ohio2) TaxID=859194 RepID=F6FHW5_MYCHI|nr:hypothetical protein MHF_0541 [Mycoplasma haemofelis Ohio2]
MDAKLLGLVGALGTASAAGGTYLFMSNSKNSSAIFELFKSEKGLKLITNDSDSQWDTAWKKYRADHLENQIYKEKDLWNISNWSEKKTSESAFDEFKRECKKRFDIKVRGIDSKEYKEVKKYCSRAKTVSELLSENKSKTLLDKAGDEGGWNAAWKTYKEANIQSNTGSAITYKTTDIWQVTGWNHSSPRDTAIEGYKTKCEEKWNSYIDPDKWTSDTIFQQVESWCTKTPS